MNAIFSTVLKAIRSRIGVWAGHRPARAARLVLVLAMLAVPLAACSVTPSVGVTPSATAAAASTGATSGAAATTAPTNPSVGTTPSPSPTSTTAPTASTTPTPSSASAPASPAATPAGTTPSAAVAAAIKSVIQRGNQEQTQALAAGNPALMQDTSTSSYYTQLVQTQNALASAGVSSIGLVKLTWGPITLTNATTAQATTVETWNTTLANGATQQDTNTNVYTLVLQNGTWKVQDDQQPGAPQTPPSTTSSPGGNPSPVSPIAPAVPAGGAGQSQNWAGYAATGGNFSAVSGSWTVPQVSPSSAPAADAAWVGIGGVTSTDLIQAGTDAAVQGGQVTYAAWIETLPQAQQTVPLAIAAGDHVSVSIAQQASGMWQITIRDTTSGQSYQKSVSYASSNSSAEWVEEAPAVGQNFLLPLDNFGTVTFSGASTVENGKTQSIAQAGGQAITMYGATGQPLAQPSGLSSNGAGFTVTRTSVPASPISPRRGGFPGGSFSG